MIGVDTSVLVRLFVTDDPRQSEVAKRFFTERSAADPAYIGLVVLAELTWLLKDTYKFPHADVLRVLKGMLASADFALERAQIAMDAVELAESKRIDVADFIIARVAAEGGSRATMTFDGNAAKRIPGMELLK